MANKAPKVLSFVSKGAKAKENNEDGTVVDHGKIGNLDYSVLSRGVIHITDGKQTFKKDPDLFEEKLEELDFTKITEGTPFTIEGSGDNADLIFSLKDGDIHLSLKAKEFGIVRKLRDIISRGKSQSKPSKK